MIRMSLVSIAALALCSVASAVPITFTSQGRLMDGAGTPLNGTTSVTFTLFGASDGSDERWSETLSVTPSDGYFAVELGKTDVLDSTVVNGDTLYLQIDPANGPALEPLSPVLSVPYAMRSGGLSLSASEPFTCDSTQTGAAYFDTTTLAMQVCDGTSWSAVASGSSGASGATCKQILAADPTATDGVYWLDADGAGPNGAFQTWCDMANGGWTLLAKTEAGDLVSSERDTIRRDGWYRYTVEGYGAPEADSEMFWLPLSRWHQLTSANPDNVWRVVDSVNEMRHHDFAIGDNAAEYPLTFGAAVSGYLSVGFPSGYRFTTVDNDNDTWPMNCSYENAPGYNGGFWYNQCSQNSMLHGSNRLYSWRNNISTEVTFISVWMREN